eukprot:TRINITY_DN24526_c0_g1_i1.p1 TRINITY_DN24526_c0_g1~~TRINITY_DN24526_c0_g1_i1.p1  ORF type:complete len:709 (+),score=159.70 TRINITY_DN24526_c0_g1_i1:112-2238(+)
MSALTPPHGPTLGSGHIVLEASPLLETVTWLVERVQDQHLCFEKLQKELAVLQSQTAQIQSSEVEGAKTGAAAAEDQPGAPAEQGKAPEHRKVEGRATAAAAAGAPAAAAAASDSAEMLAPRGTPAYQELQVDIVKLQRALEELQEEVQTDVHRLTADIGACLQEESLQPLIDQHISQLKESFREELEQLRSHVQADGSSPSGAGNVDAAAKDSSGDAPVPDAVASGADSARFSSLEQRLDELAAELAAVKEQNEALTEAQAKEQQETDLAARADAVKQDGGETVDSAQHSTANIQEHVHSIEHKLEIIFSAFGVEPENLQAGSLASLGGAQQGASPPVDAGNVPHVSPSDLADATGSLTLRIEGLEQRLGKLEELNAATPGGKGGYGGALAGAYERVAQLVDDADAKGSSSAKAVADEALGTSASGCSGGSGDEPSASAAQLKAVIDDLKDLKQKYSSLSAQLSASPVSGTVEQAAGAGDIEIQRAEGAALRAESAAAAAQKLKDQLDEALQTIEEGRYRKEQQTAEDLETCTNQQRQMEDTLKRLEAHIQSDDPEIASTLNAVVTDVRYCLKRCELLFQLPEIKVYIKRFQASLQVNAVLQDRWLGPAGREKKMFEDIGEAPEEGAEGTLLGSRPEHTQSTGDLPTAPGGRIASKKNQADQKKRPFRTVTDWARPHTPLSIDPVLRPPSRESRETGSLPQISPGKH